MDELYSKDPLTIMVGDFKEYQDGHIPGAVRFDPRVVADKNAEGMMLPPAEQFAQQVGEVSPGIVVLFMPQKQCR